MFVSPRRSSHSAGSSEKPLDEPGWLLLLARLNDMCCHAGIQVQLDHIEQYAHKLVLPPSWSLKADAHLPLIQAAERRYKNLPDLCFVLESNSIADAQTLLPNSLGDPYRILFSCGMLSMLADYALAVASLVDFNGVDEDWSRHRYSDLLRHEEDVSYVDEYLNVATWLIPRLDSFMRTQVPASAPSKSMKWNWMQIVFAKQLFDGAARFLVAHELGHVIYRAELDPSAAALGTQVARDAEIWEMNPKKWAEEYAADVIGVRLALDTWRLNNLKDLLVALEIRSCSREIARSFKRYFGGMQLLPSFLQLTDIWNKRRLGTKTHPPAFKRLILMTWCLHKGHRSAKLALVKGDKPIRIDIWELESYANDLERISRNIGDAVITYFPYLKSRKRKQERGGQHRQLIYAGILTACGIIAGIFAWQYYSKGSLSWAIINAFICVLGIGRAIRAVRHAGLL